MDGRNEQQRERQAVMQHAYREELVERIGRVVREDGVEEPLPGVHLARSSVSLQPVHSVVEPSICVIAQGSKEVLLGESRYHYDPTHYLLTTVALPRVSQVLSASKEHPYLSLRLELDPSLVSSVAVEVDHIWSKQQVAVSAITVSLLDDHLLEAFVRLVRLVDSPAHARALGPLITREFSTGFSSESKGVGSVTWRFKEAILPILSRRSSDCANTSTSPYASRRSRGISA